tara:strand:+ start:8540 stop:9430 length:891 start_codon:yes stop_codon:yes gene_type:complete
MNLPNLLIVGAAKSGTTSLHNYLKQHPEIFMSNHKEPHFLINKEIGENRIPKAVKKLDEYSNLFDGSDTFKYRGESSAMYLQFPNITIKNIKKYLEKDIKIIIMLRNPIDRAFSGYQHVKRFNIDEELTFEQALEVCEDRYFKQTSLTPATRYIHIGMYYDFVKKFMHSFSDQIHVIIYDDFIADTQNELSKVFSFLEVKKIEININEKYMVGGWKWKNSFFKNTFMKKSFLKKIIKTIAPFEFLRIFLNDLFKYLFTEPDDKMDIAVRKKLQNIYKNDVINLSKLLNKDLNFWIK